MRKKNLKNNIYMYIYTYRYITESLYYTPETNMTLQINLNFKKKGDRKKGRKKNMSNAKVDFGAFLAAQM